MSQTYLLSPEQHKFYKENGYIVVKGLIDFSILYACKLVNAFILIFIQPSITYFEFRNVLLSQWLAKTIWLAYPFTNDKP